MWIEFSKIVVCFYFCSTVGCAYHMKNDYAKQSEKKPNKKYSVSGPNYSNDNLNVRQSRYPNFDKVMTRIENMNTGGGDSSGSNELGYKIRHKGWSGYRPSTTTTTSTTTTDDGLFETYGNLENDDDFDEYDDALDDEFEYDDDDDSFFDSIENIQAEEPTTERPTIAPKTVSSLTEYKWRNFGTASRVEESRRQHLNMRVPNEQNRISAVLEHYVRVNQQGKCRKPLPKVIPVQREHPDPSKTYTPHCTVLHRCAEDTGCCKHDTNCQYKTRDLVQLYFYTKTLGSTETKVEKLNFYNHTECECKDKSNYTSVESMIDSSSGLSFRSADSYRPPQNIRRCKCPKHFQSKPTYDHDSCTCDCEEGNLDCIQLKKGKEHISMTDRICIANNECDVPKCEYGPYSIKAGKCPSKNEKIEEFRSIRIHY